MKGKLYGVSIGPGDPELLTLRSKRILEECDVIGYPVKEKGERSTALSIIDGIIDLDGREIREFVFSMDPNDSVRRGYERVVVSEVIPILEQGKDVALITLGDAGIYSTYMYVDQAVRGAGYESEIVPGINSFTFGASKAGLPLVMGDEGLCVVPMAKDRDDLLIDALRNFENVVIMKAFKSMAKVSEIMESCGVPLTSATVLSNVGMSNEYIGPLDVDRDYSYFTTILIKRSV